MEVHSVSEALDVTINVLTHIQIPTELTAITFTQAIGGPIMTAVSNLYKIREAVLKAEQPEQEVIPDGNVQDDPPGPTY